MAQSADGLMVMCVIIIIVVLIMIIITRKISFCDKFQALRVPCLPEIVKCLGRKPAMLTVGRF